MPSMSFTALRSWARGIKRDVHAICLAAGGLAWLAFAMMGWRAATTAALTEW